MDEGPVHQLVDPGLSSGYAFDQSRKGITSGSYCDENLEKGLGIDVSSIFYYAANGGGPYSSGSGKGISDSRYGNSGKMVSQHSAADIFSVPHPTNVSKDHGWDQIDFSKKVPDPYCQFYEGLGLGNSNIVSQHSNYNSGLPVTLIKHGVSESSSQTFERQTDLLGPLINCENYMNSCVREMFIDQESRLNSSFTDGLQSSGEPSNVASSVEISKSLRGRSETFFASCLNLKPLGVSSSRLGENKRADDSSLHGVLVYKPSKPSHLRDTVGGNYVTSPVDASESYFNSLGRSCTTLSGVDDAKSDDPSLRGTRVNKSVDSYDLQTIGKGSDNIAGSLGTIESHHHKNDGCFDPSPGFKPPGLSSTSTSMQCSSEDAEVCQNDMKDSAEDNDVESPVDTGESYYLGGERCTGLSHAVDPQKLSASVSMQFTAASPMEEDTDTDENEQTFQGSLISEPTEGRKSDCQKGGRRSNGSSDIAPRCLRKCKEESAYPSRNKKPVDSGSKPRRKASKGIPMAAGKQDPDSDEEYEPSHSGMKKRRSQKAGDRRKNNKLWTLSEVTKLVDGISQFGVGKWTAIRKNYFGSSPHRTSLDIRDKWRNLLRTSVVQLDDTKENPKNGTVILPRSLLQRVRDLDDIHPYYKNI